MCEASGPPPPFSVFLFQEHILKVIEVKKKKTHPTVFGSSSLSEQEIPARVMLSTASRFPFLLLFSFCIHARGCLPVSAPTIPPRLYSPLPTGILDACFNMLHFPLCYFGLCSGQWTASFCFSWRGVLLWWPLAGTTASPIENAAAAAAWNWGMSETFITSGQSFLPPLFFHCLVFF